MASNVEAASPGALLQSQEKLVEKLARLKVNSEMMKEKLQQI